VALPASAAGHPAGGDLDAALAALADSRRAFARLAPAEKAALLRATLPRFGRVAEAWVAAGCRAKSIPVDTALGGEEWLAGPMPSVRNVRLLTASLDAIAARGRPPLGRKLRTRDDGRLEVEVMPSDGWDATLRRGISCSVLMQPGVDEAGARQRQAAFYQRREPEGGTSLILGAGNVASIPVMDALYKMFVDGNVSILKLSPVNEWVGPFLAEALEPLIARRFLRIVYGGADVGAYLSQHPAVDDIHITGSDRTHDAMVWGPPGPEQERRKRAQDPALRKPITSELGNVSAVAVVPGHYTDKEIWFQARNLATMVGNNASFNCNAAKMLITAPGWPQRDLFLDRFRAALRQIPPRVPYYPGARERYAELVGSRRQVETFGEARDGALPWAFIPFLEVDAGRADEPLFRVESFCGVLAHTEVGEGDAASFLASVTRFCNERLWGTLNVTLIIDPRTEADPGVARALDRAIVDLNYGTVAINVWPAVAYGSVSPPWGGHPSATLANIQSGLGWVHNTFMLDGIEKSILRSTITLSPKPAWYCDNQMTHVIGRRLVSFESRPSLWRFPALAAAGLRG
jgi:acyl-CoA reductase-like NAD-dependent aldehyde dehydrogenase